MIRVTGGKYRSRQLLTPETNLTKPTMDKVRAGVFNALGNHLDGLYVLDLFAGSGSYGFESLSRNAQHVDFVDQTEYSKKCVEENASKLCAKNFKFFKQDVLVYLKECKQSYNLIFMDPPYKLDIIKEVLEVIDSHHLLKDNGAVVVESEHEITFDENYREIRHYKYGLAHIYLLRK